MPNIDVNTTLENLIEAWCDRREYKALAIVLPTWLANNGLTDGWGELGTRSGTYTQSAENFQKGI